MLNHQITTEFNQRKPPQQTVAVVVDMSKAFDNVNIHTLMYKLTQTDIPTTVTKIPPNYINGRQAWSTHFSTMRIKRMLIKIGVPQGGARSLNCLTFTLQIPLYRQNIHC